MLKKIIEFRTKHLKMIQNKYQITFFRKNILTLSLLPTSIELYTKLNNCKTEFESAYIIEQGLKSRNNSVIKEAADQIIKKITSPELKLELFNIAIAKNQSLISNLNIELILSEKDPEKRESLQYAYVKHHLAGENKQRRNQIFKELIVLVPNDEKRLAIFAEELLRASLQEREYYARYFLRNQPYSERVFLIKTGIQRFEEELAIVLINQISVLTESPEHLSQIESTINKLIGDPREEIRNAASSQFRYFEPQIKTQLEEKMASRKFLLVPA